MLKPYQRRAFLLIALATLEPTATLTARAAVGSELSVLAQTGSLAPRVNSVAAIGVTPTKSTAPVPTFRQVRRPLGPIPGFTLPTNRTVAVTPDSKNARKHTHGGLFGSLGDWLNQMGNATDTHIKVTGHQTTSLRMDSISGNDTSYHDEQYYGRGSGGFYNDTDLTVDATLFKYLTYQTRITNSPFVNPDENRIKLDYNTGKFRLEWGDLNAGFQGNSLIDFNRYLRGVQVSDQWAPGIRSTLLYSQTKAGVHTITIAGNNSAGPYYVYAGQIVEGSDQVRVDNRPMVRGQDYTLDTYTGQLNFLGGNVILQSSTIAVSFETLGDQNSGSIYGFRTEYVPHNGPRFGLTYVMQQAPGSSILQPQSQQWLGPITPNTFLYLNAPLDVTKPLSVTLGGLPLQPGIDYQVNTSLLNQILLVQSVPAGVVLQVTYVPLNTDPNPGNRSVLGLDGRLPLGKLGSLTTEMALSGLSLSGNDISGHAWQVIADLTPLRNLHTKVTLRDVNPTFSSIESPGFNRNERAGEITADYAPTRALKFTLDWLKSERPSYSASDVSQFSVNPVGFDDYNQYNLGANYKFSRNASLNLTHDSLSTDYALGGSSSNLNDALTLSYSLRAVSLEAGLSRNRSTAVGISDLTATGLTSTGTTQLSDYSTSTFSKHVGLRWQASHWLTLSGNFSDNDITSEGLGVNGPSDARDMQLSANLNLIRNLRLTYGYQLTDTGSNSSVLSSTNPTSTTTPTSGSTSTGVIGQPVRSLFAPFPLLTRATSDGSDAGTTTPVAGNTLPTAFGSGGYNYNLGSFGNYSSYYGSSYNALYGDSSFGGRSYTNRISLNYTPHQSLQLGLQLDQGSSVGNYQYNSSRSNVGFNIGWQPSARLQLNASYAVQQLAYTNGYGSSNSNTLMLAVQGHPFGRKLGVQLSWQSLRTTSNVDLAEQTTTTPTTTGTGTIITPTDANTNLSSLSLRLDYPIFRRQTLFVELFSSDASGYLGSIASDLRIGIDYALTQALKFSFGWQSVKRINKDPTDAQYNYSANSVLAELGFRF
jgi:hypothetical protein